MQPLSDDPDLGNDGGTYVPSFEVVLADAKRGDSAAFEQLFVALSRRVHAFLRVRGAVDPEGMVNDVFLKVFTNLGGFVGNEVQFAAWVFRITRNAMIDDARRMKRRPVETSVETAGEIDAASGDVEIEALGQLGNSWVLEQLSVLTQEQREVVLLRIVADLTIEAIAEVLDKRVGAVKALQRRAFRTLARNIDGEAAPL